jgi:protein phosphatase
MLISLADPSFVLLIGPSGSGKSTFARRHFRATEVLSSDFCRALVCDDEANQAATDDAFELLHLIVLKRLQRRRMTVIDATNVQGTARRPLEIAAGKWGVPLVAIVFRLPEEICQQRNRQRAYRQVPVDVIQTQIRTLEESWEHLSEEGFDAIFTINDVAEADLMMVARHPAYS